MRVRIIGYDLPGRQFCDAAGEPLVDVLVGLQIRRDPAQLVAADAEIASWEIDVAVVAETDGSPDFKGPAVHGKRGDRFLYLTWGVVDDQGDFAMFRRAKLMLNRIDADIVELAESANHQLVARVRMTDAQGAPRCARVDPPDIAWSIDDS